MTKKLVAILIAVIISLSMMISASAYTYQYIEDSAGNLTYDEIEELEAYAEKIESTYGICIMLGITQDTDGMSDSEYAQKIYTDNTDNENGFILVHNDSESTYGVFTSLTKKQSMKCATLTTQAIAITAVLLTTTRLQKACLQAAKQRPIMRKPLQQMMTPPKKRTVWVLSGFPFLWESVCS